MTRRWERELRSLREIPAPVERIRARSAERPSRPTSGGPPPGRQRLTAGIVALVVFVAAGAFAWRAFEGNGVVDETVGSTRSIAPTETAPPPDDGAVVYSAPFFMGVDGWHTRDPWTVEDGTAAWAWASTIPFEEADRSDSAPAIPPATIEQLPPDGIVVTALATPWSFDPELGPYPPIADRPLDLGQATLRGPEAEEPPGDYSILETETGYILVRVYFGMTDPSAELIGEAQHELDTLEIPPVCPMPAEGGFGATMSTTEGAPGDAITIDGPMPFRHEDGSFDRSGDTRMIVWWNASPEDWALLSSFSNVEPSPAEEGPLLRLGEGGRDACSFSIAFTVPDVPPGDYPIVVLQEGGGGSTMEAALTFTAR